MTRLDPVRPPANTTGPDYHGTTVVEGLGTRDVGGSSRPYPCKHVTSRFSSFGTMLEGLFWTRPMRGECTYWNRRRRIVTQFFFLDVTVDLRPHHSSRKVVHVPEKLSVLSSQKDNVRSTSSRSSLSSATEEPSLRINRRTSSAKVKIVSFFNRFVKRHCFLDYFTLEQIR